ncbi:MAG: response regulator receiver protein [Candidatus Solibacter sp.]|nr:response regulator receiver protein [Candidatus Solibacter sp.]
MTKTTLTVLLIEDSQEYAELVRRWLSTKDNIEFVVHWTDSLMAGLHRLTNGDVDVILLDLGLPDSQGFGTFTTATTHALGIPIVILSGGDTESLALQMVQQGAQDYIIKGGCNREVLVRSLRFAVSRSSQLTSVETVPDQGTVIGVMGAKGGVGATTLACNLAIELRRQTDQRTLLADLDLNAGLVSFLMNAEAEHTILDAVTNAQFLDRSFWDRQVAHGFGGVDVVRSPNLLGIEAEQMQGIQDVLAMIRTFYRWTVLDLGRMTSLSLSLLERVNQLYLVTTFSVPALYEAKRTIGALMKAGLDTDRLRVVLNHVGASQNFSGDELGRIFGVPVYANLPSAAQELHDACAQEELLVGSSGYRVQMARLARRVAGLSEERSGPVAQFRSFTSKFRRNTNDTAVATRD